jgi:hypothetical protein
LNGAHQEAAERQSEKVAPIDLLCAAWRALPDAIRPRMKVLGAVAGEPPKARVELSKKRFFGAFDNAARQTLGQAAKAAAALGRDSISPAHLILGALEADEDLRERTALTPTTARFALTDADDDPTPLPTDPIGIADELFQLFDPLPDGSETTAMLGRFLSHGPPEVRALLVRQKVTPALFERAGGSFSDPDPPE